MKLLFDENLSAELPGRLADLFPGSAHVRDVGLKAADDVAIWRFAAEQGFAIVTKDDDFRERSVLEGSPPKVVMIVAGNCSTEKVIQLLRGAANRLANFAADHTTTLLELG